MVTATAIACALVAALLIVYRNARIVTAEDSAQLEACYRVDRRKHLGDGTHMLRTQADMDAEINRNLVAYYKSTGNKKLAAYYAR